MRVENQTKGDSYKNFVKKRKKIQNEKTLFLKEIFLYCHHFFIEKDNTCENGEMKKGQAIETNTAGKMSNSKRERKKPQDVMVNLKSNKKRDVSEISDEKSLHHNGSNGNLSNLRNLNGLTGDESENLEKGSDIRCEEKYCLKLEEETWLKIIPKSKQ